MINKGKKDFVVWAIILCFLSAISSLGYVLTAIFAFDKMHFLYGVGITASELEVARMGDIIIYSLDTAINVAAAICLIFYLKKAEVNPPLGKKLFFAGLILNVFASPLAIASILLYIAHFKYPDFERVSDDSEQEIIVEASEDELKRKIAKLRELKENGTITEEEFEKELMKLL